MKQKILQWLKRAFKPRLWWRVVVSYDRGPALVWETREPWHLLHRHLPKLGERHGDQIVIQWEVMKIKRPAFSTPREPIPGPGRSFPRMSQGE